MFLFSVPFFFNVAQSVSKLFHKEKDFDDDYAGNST